MTQALLCFQTPAADAPRPLRLRMKHDLAARGYVDGAWWPYSDDLTAELPSLLATLARRLGPIGRVLYRNDEWSSLPRKALFNRGVVRLDGYRLQRASTIEVQGLNRSRLVLLVVPPPMSPDEAYDTMTAAAASDSTATVGRLLGSTVPRRMDLAVAAVARQRWASRGVASVIDEMQLAHCG